MSDLGFTPGDETHEIPLVRSNLVVLVDAADFTWASQYRWYLSNGYARRFRAGGKSVYMHRELASAPDGADVDHANGNKLNNRRQNLRVCSRAENLRNSRKRKTWYGRPTSSQYKGVSRHHTGRWTAKITVPGGKYISLGNYTTEEEAHAAYCAAAKKHHGVFARVA